MKIVNVCVIAALGLSMGLSTGCSRNKQDAILLANEAEKLRKGNKDEAIAKLEEATRLDPDNHQVWYKLATLHEEKEAWPQMADALQGAIDADERTPDDGTWATYQAKKGYALEKQAQKNGRYEDAKAPYLKCIEVDENYADCYHQLGNVYLWMDDEQNALVYYTKAIEHAPDELRYYGPLASLYLALNETKLALDVLNEAKTRGKPNDKELWFIHTVLADIYLNVVNKPDEAVKELEAAKAIDTGEDNAKKVETLFSLGLAYSTMTPIRKQDATDNLKGFYNQICKTPKEAEYKLQCKTAQTVLTKKLNASLQ
ncbi:MAG: tetratricopeptide repeat protein [Polyangiaceae bacterium]